MLNACALNSRPLDSRIANRLPRPKSKLTNPGPRTAPFDSFPKVPGVGYTKALVLNHCVRVFGPLALAIRSEEHTSELQSLTNLVCRLLLEKKKSETYYTR